MHDTKFHHSICILLIEQCREILTNLKRRSRYADVNLTKMQDVKDEYQQNSEQLRKYESASRMKSIIALGSGIIIAPVLVYYTHDYQYSYYTYGLSILLIGFGIVKLARHYSQKSEMQRVQAVAKQKQTEVVEEVVSLCQTKLIPSLKTFIEGLNMCAEYFSETEIELQNLLAKNKPKNLYYNKMKDMSAKIIDSCNGFAYVLPDVRSDMNAIREKPLDKNYIDEWEQNQLNAIKNKYDTESIIQSILNFVD